MLHLNIKTASTPEMAVTNNPGEPLPTIHDVDEDHSLASTPSTSGSHAPFWDIPHASPEHHGPPHLPQSPQTPENSLKFDRGPYPHCPIYIPSKGRSDLDRSTMATLVRDLIPFVLVVEQDEVELYAAMIDRLVAQHFGCSGMTYATTDDSAEGDGGTPDEAAQNEGGDEAAPSVGGAESCEAADVSDLWQFRCACCDHNCNVASAGVADLSADAAEALALRLSKLFHHGYIFTPTAKVTAEDSATATASHGGTLPEAGDGTDGRRASEAFVLRDVDRVRELFTIEVLPEANRGVSYVRNYILQVLVPRVMVACGLDRTGNVEELCLCGSGEQNTLTPAALRMTVLEPYVSRALEERSAVERFFDSRRGRPSAASSAVVSETAASSGAEEAASTEAAGVSPVPAPPVSQTKSLSLFPPSASEATARDTPRLVHGLLGFYWVLDDDIYGFYQSFGAKSKNRLITAREMLREVESRLRRLRHNADVASPPPPPVPPSSAQVAAAQQGNNSGSTMVSPYVLPPQSSSQQPQQFPIAFTCKEDALLHNTMSSQKIRLATLSNYTFYYTTACFSLEYNRFALDTARDTLAVNSYNNIACLFNYALLHNPPQMRFFPPGVLGVRRPEETLVGYLGHNMLWYRFALREDYDFTLQLIARGLQTLRFRSLAFDVPQMMKLRGGMTDYYRNCHEEIRAQNERFLRQWPSVAQNWVKGKEGNRRDDIRVRWDLLNPLRVKHPGAFLYLGTPLPQLQPQRLTEDVTGSGSVEGGSASSESVEGESRKRQRPSDASQPQNQPWTTTSTRYFSTSGTAPPLPVAPRDRKGGYVIERWRCLTPEEALAHGDLAVLPNDDIHIGQTVAVVPPFFDQRPSVVRATVIERSLTPLELPSGATRASSADSGSGLASASRVVWTAVAQDVRGMPFLHVDTCYAIPPRGIEEAAKGIDEFFSNMPEDSAG